MKSAFEKSLSSWICDSFQITWTTISGVFSSPWCCGGHWESSHSHWHGCYSCTRQPTDTSLLLLTDRSISICSFFVHICMCVCQIVASYRSKGMEWMWIWILTRLKFRVNDNGSSHATHWLIDMYTIYCIPYCLLKIGKKRKTRYLYSINIHTDVFDALIRQEESWRPPNARAKTETHGGQGSQAKRAASETAGKRSICDARIGNHCPVQYHNARRAPVGLCQQLGSPPRKRVVSSTVSGGIVSGKYNDICPPAKDASGRSEFSQQVDFE